MQKFSFFVIIAKGETGLKGDKGETGLQGQTGQIGPQGIQGIQGKQGERGNVNFAWLALDPLTGILSQYADDEYNGANFEFNPANGRLYAIKGVV